MSRTHDDPLGVKTDYTAILRAGVSTLVKGHCRRTGESYKETWDHLYARLLETSGFSPEDYQHAHKLKGSKLHAVEQAGYLGELHSLAEQLD